MLMFGNKETFALSVATGTVGIHIAGALVTDSDNSPYLPSFTSALQASEKALRSRLNFLAHESLFLGMSVSDAFHALASPSTSAHEMAFNELRFADWGATTDSYLSLLLPINGRLYVACSPVGGDAVQAAVVWPYEIISTINRALVAMGPNNSFKPKPLRGSA